MQTLSLQKELNVLYAPKGCSCKFPFPFKTNVFFPIFWHLSVIKFIWYIHDTTVSADRDAEIEFLAVASLKRHFISYCFRGLPSRINLCLIESFLGERVDFQDARQVSSFAFTNVDTSCLVSLSCLIQNPVICRSEIFRSASLRLCAGCVFFHWYMYLYISVLYHGCDEIARDEFSAFRRPCMLIGLFLCFGF